MAIRERARRRCRVLPILLCVFFTFSGLRPNRADAQVGELLTVGAAIVGARLAIDHASDRLRELGSDLVGEVDGALRNRLSQLEGILHEQLAKPIGELTGEFRRAVDEVVAISNNVNAIVSRLQTCLDITVAQAVQQLHSIATNFGAENVPFSNAQPRITGVIPIDGRPLTVMPWEGRPSASPPRLIALQGAFVRYDASCGVARLFASRAGYRDLGEPLVVTHELTIVSANAEEVRARFPTEKFRYGGLFTFSYVFPSRSTQCDPASAYYGMLVPSEVGPFVMVNLAVEGMTGQPLKILVGGPAGEATNRRIDGELMRTFGNLQGARWILSATAAAPDSRFIDFGRTAPATGQRLLTDASGYRISWIPDDRGGDLRVSFPQPTCR